MKPTLYYTGQPGDGYGWGVCNRELSRALGKYYEVKVGHDGLPDRVDGHLFTPISNSELEPACLSRGSKTIGYCFTEYPLSDRARVNAAHYDVIFCGSTWNKNRLALAGIPGARVLIQGVDGIVFHPKKRERANDVFTVFSGGKFEPRKGQDIVLEAFKILRSRIPCRLITAWQNPWPATMRFPGYRWLEWNDVWNNCRTWPELFGKIAADCGVKCKDGELAFLPCLDQQSLANTMRACDAAVFPNRCEAGTNLVMMEAMACGLPVVATAGTGHMDILTSENSVMVPGEEDDKGWVEVDPRDIANALERIAGNRNDYLAMAEKASQVTGFSWQETAKTFWEGACQS